MGIFKLGLSTIIFSYTALIKFCSNLDSDSRQDLITGFL